MLGCLRAILAADAVAMLGRMRAAGVAPNEVTYAAAISAAAAGGEWVRACALLDEMEAALQPEMLATPAYVAAVSACARRSESMV